MPTGLKVVMWCIGGHIRQVLMVVVVCLRAFSQVVTAGAHVVNYINYKNSSALQKL